MTIFLAVILGIALSNGKAAGNGEFFEDYLSRERIGRNPWIYNTVILFRRA